MRRPATTSAKQRVRSVRKNMKGAASHATVAIDSFVEDSQDSLPQYSVRKPRRRRVGASAICDDLRKSAVEGIGSGRDDEEDKYNLLESTQELELPCCRAESVDQMTVCAEVDADLTTVTELSHIVSDVVNASPAAAAASAVVCEQATVVHNQPVIAAHSNIQTPEPLPPPVLSESDMNQSVYEQLAVTHSCPHRLPSLPTQQLDVQLDTPAAATRKRSSVVDKVGGHFSSVTLFISISMIVH